MITSIEFYRAFDRGFASVPMPAQVVRARGKSSRYRVTCETGFLLIWFRVNPKSVPLPYRPGDFWPAVEAPAPIRHKGGQDDGTVSWYQYTSASDAAAIQRLRLEVLERTAAQKLPACHPDSAGRDEAASILGPLLQVPPEPRFPHSQLPYLDTDDAARWGELFAMQLPAWIEHFDAGPETLVTHMWRTHCEEDRPDG